MKASEFSRVSPGRLVEATDAQGHRGQAFIPDLLPPAALNLGGPDIRRALSLADQQIARLDGIAGQLAKPEDLFSNYLRREAQLSSAIEGTRTTLVGLALAEASRKERSVDERVVLNYVDAFKYGLDRVREVPLGRRLFDELHQKLMRGEPDRVTPGRIRDCLVVIGNNLSEARFVPPPHYEVPMLLDDLESYMNRDHEPGLIKLAIAHYQFEAIHPFRDGNGRIGRMMIALWLQQQKILTRPMLYLSAYFAENKNEYYDALLKVSTRGSWEDWILFFLKGIAQQSSDASRRTKALIALRDDYYNRVAGPRSSQGLLKVIDDLFILPAMSVPLAAKLLGVTYNAARESVRKLETANILSDPSPINGTNYWIAHELIQKLEEPLPEDPG